MSTAATYFLWWALWCLLTALARPVMAAARGLVRFAAAWKRRTDEAEVQALVARAQHRIERRRRARP